MWWVKQGVAFFLLFNTIFYNKSWKVVTVSMLVLLPVSPNGKLWCSFPLWRSSLRSFAPFLYSYFHGHFLMLNFFSPLILFCGVLKLVRIKTSCESLERKKMQKIQQKQIHPWNKSATVPMFLHLTFSFCLFHFSPDERRGKKGG